MSTEPFASWFRNQLKRRGWSNADFARESTVPRATVFTWAKGTRVPDPESCDIIADVFGTDLDWVLNLAGHRPNIEDLKPDDPRTDLIARIRRIEWNAEREAIVRGVLDPMPKAKAK